MPRVVLSVDCLGQLKTHAHHLPMHHVLTVCATLQLPAATPHPLSSCPSCIREENEQLPVARAAYCLFIIKKSWRQQRPHMGYQSLTGRAANEECPLSSAGLAPHLHLMMEEPPAQHLA